MAEVTSVEIPAAGCPIRDVLDHIGDKWSVLTLAQLQKGPLRFNELKRRLDGISQKVLTTTLRKLERDGYIEREVFTGYPVRVEYKMTDVGNSVLVPIGDMITWASKHQNRILYAREIFDTKTAKTAN